MNIAVAKIVKKWRIPYHVPARYGSAVCYRVWKDNELVYDGVDPNYKRLTKKQVINWVKKKYDFIVVEVKDYGALYT